MQCYTTTFLTNPVVSEKIVAFKCESFVVMMFLKKCFSDCNGFKVVSMNVIFDERKVRCGIESISINVTYGKFSGACALLIKSATRWMLLIYVHRWSIRV